MVILGVGHDVVDVAGFAGQLEESGEGMRRLFSVRELRQSTLRAQAKHDGEAVHLAARWAGKEAVLKAWCEALEGRRYPYTLDDFPWAQIEILDDSRGCPRVVLSDSCHGRLHDSLLDSDGGAVPGTGAQSSGRVSEAVGSSADGSGIDDGSAGHVGAVGGMGGTGEAGGALRWHISLSHDGPVASAVVMLVFE